MNHGELRESLGGYVLGALDGDARHAVDAHLRDCAACREELAALSSLPPLLNRLSAPEAAATLARPSGDLRQRIVAAGAAEARRERRRLARWRLAAIAAALAAVVLALVPLFDRGSGGAEPLRAAPAPVATDASAVTGEIAAYDWEWGTTVELRLAALPARTGYVLWAVAADGTRLPAGTWGPTAEGDVRLYGAAGLRRDDLASVEVAAPDGEILLTFPFLDDAPARASGP